MEQSELNPVASRKLIVQVELGSNGDFAHPRVLYSSRQEATDDLLAVTSLSSSLPQIQRARLEESL